MRRGIRSVRRLMADWLDRPMTSLHLILAIFALMLGFGLLMVLSSSSVAAFRNGGSSFSVFANQATYAAVGLMLFCAAQFLPVRLMRSLSTIAVIVALALLVAVLIPGIGTLVNGARSWIRLGGLQFQPSEIAKLALLLWMAHVLAARRSTLGSPKALLIPVLPVYGLMAGLIMYQPDLGTTVALTIVFMAVLFFAGAPRWMFATLGALGVAGFFFLAISAEYRLARLLSFINPEEHPEVSYQLLQSLYGMGNGGWFGVGLGQSRAKWSYLPNADSDFIFAIIGEELGLIGAGILLLLFALLAYTGLRIARRNVDPFVKIVASAATVWLVGQAAINIGYVVGLLPVTGIPLPMISAGGTSLLITMVVFGLLANFARREPQAAAALAAGGGGRLARFLGIRHSDSSGVKSVSRRRRRKTAAAAGAVAAASGPRRGPRTTGPSQEQPRRARRPMDRPLESPPRTAGSRDADQRGADQRGREPRPGERRAPDQRGGQQRRADPRGAGPRGAGPRGAGQRGGDPRAAGPTSGDPRGRTGRRGGE
jgi:cell division protein FtsW